MVIGGMIVSECGWKECLAIWSTSSMRCRKGFSAIGCCGLYWVAETVAVSFHLIGCFLYLLSAQDV